MAYPGGFSVVPRPVFAQGLVFVSSGFMNPVLLAIRPDGRGDVTDTHVAWSESKSIARNASFLAVGDEIYVVSDNGIATCLDVTDGKRVADVVAKHGVRSIIHLAGMQVPFCKAAPALGADDRDQVAGAEGRSTSSRAGSFSILRLSATMGCGMVAEKSQTRRSPVACSRMASMSSLLSS